MKAKCIQFMMLLAVSVPFARSTRVSAQPANDECSNATIIVSTPFVLNGDTTDATTDGDNSCAIASGTDVWFS